MLEEKLLTVNEVAELLDIPVRTVRERCRLGIYEAAFDEDKGGRQYKINLSSLPVAARNSYYQKDGGNDDGKVNAEEQLRQYNAAPAYARRKAEKYLAAFAAAGNRRGKELEAFLEQYSKDNPEQQVSYKSYMRLHKEYARRGLVALLGGWGKRRGKSGIDDRLFERFKDKYMSDSRTSAESCRVDVIGFALRNGIVQSPSEVPSAVSFKRRLKREVPLDAIEYARLGPKAWDRKYGRQIIRDWDNVLAGECWFSDHAQLDVTVSYRENGKTKYAYPWITSWSDAKSGKWLGWDLHIEPPNSDHIFMAFFRAARDHGVPSKIYIDNGKDYKHRDFTGGVRIHKLVVDENKRTLTGILQIRTIFAIPYSPQAKRVERDHLLIKERFSKHCEGYRGGNVVERPESLKKQIADGDIIPFENMITLFDDFITSVLNTHASVVDRLKGQCPDECWEKEAPEAYKSGVLRRMHAETLSIFCSRTSKVVTVRQNGIYDSELDCWYWAEWLVTWKGRKVYHRRDTWRHNEAWVFNAETDEMIGTAQLVRKISAICETDVERAELKKAMQKKRQNRKIIAEYAKVVNPPAAEESVENMAVANAAMNAERGYTPSEKTPADAVNYIITDADRWQAEQRKRERLGTQDPSIMTPPAKQKTVQEEKQEYFIFQKDVV